MGECSTEEARYITQQHCLCSLPDSDQGCSQTGRGAFDLAEHWLTDMEEAFI